MNWHFPNFLKVLTLFLIFGLNPTLSHAKPKIVVILDTGLNLEDPRFKSILCKFGHKDFTGKGMEDKIGHGTHVLGSIMRNAPKTGWCAVIVKNFYKPGEEDINFAAQEKAIKYLLNLKPDYVNL